MMITFTIRSRHQLIFGVNEIIKIESEFLNLQLGMPLG